MKLSPTVLAAIVGRRIRQLRESKNISLTRLAELTDMDPATLSRLERGKCSLVCLTRVDAIANALDQDLGAIVTVKRLTAADLAAILLEHPDRVVVLGVGKRREVLVDCQIDDNEIVLLGRC